MKKNIHAEAAFYSEKMCCRLPLACNSCNGVSSTETNYEIKSYPENFLSAIPFGSCGHPCVPESGGGDDPLSVCDHFHASGHAAHPGLFDGSPFWLSPDPTPDSAKKENSGIGNKTSGTDFFLESPRTLKAMIIYEHI